MNATELYRAGKLDEAVAALGDEVRKDPTDARRRTFLFELLCFAGELDRAEKQLDVLERGGKEAGLGVLLYRAAIHAERLRREVFGPGGMPPSTAAPRPVRGTLNGKAFGHMEDADPRIGARLEVFAAGQYTWLPLEQVAGLTAEEPRRLRDLLWFPARIRTADSFQGVELGEILLPVLTPHAHEHADAAVRLGRVTDWLDGQGDEPLPVGQKVWNVDGEAVPLLEVRELVIEGPADAD